MQQREQDEVRGELSEDRVGLSAKKAIKRGPETRESEET